jgi:hypothetical protein
VGIWDFIDKVGQSIKDSNDAAEGWASLHADTLLNMNLSAARRQLQEDIGSRTELEWNFLMSILNQIAENDEDPGAELAAKLAQYGGDLR